MKKIITLILFTFLVFQNFKSTAQIDTAFWFAAPFVSPDNGPTYDHTLHLYTYGAVSTTIRLRQPAALAPNKYDTTIVLGAFSTFNYTFWRDKIPNASNVGYDSLEVRPADMVLPYGLYVSSTSDISVVYDVLGNVNNPETFSLKGSNGAGLEFICPFQQKGNNSVYSDLAGPPGIIQPKQQINIVAGQANTIVWITPKCNITGHLANVTYSILLPSQGSAYTIENAVQTTTVLANNLSGTSVLANKPISVTVADDAVKALSGCNDLIGDQVVPIDETGKEYVIVKGGLNISENEGVYIAGTDNNTQLTINDGVVTTTVINKGDTYFYKTNQTLTSLIASKDVCVLQVTGMGCEMSSDVIPPLSCAGSNLVHFTRNNAQNLFLNIYCKNGIQNGFTLNNTAASVTVAVSASIFTMVPGTATLTGGPFFGANLSVSSASLPPGSYTVANSMGEFGLAVCNGGSASGSYYHYTSVFPFKTHVTAIATSTTFCIGSSSTINLNGNVTGNSPTGIWTSNGTGTFGAYTSTLNTVSTTYSLSTNDVSQNSLTFYLTSTGVCKPVKDSVTVQLIQLPQVYTSVGTALCDNSTAPVSATSTLVNATGVFWQTTGTGLFIPSNTSANISYQPSASDLSQNGFTLSINVSGLCANTIGQVAFTVVPSPTITTSSTNSIICSGQLVTLTASGANTYTWNTTSASSSIAVSPTVTTNYTVNGTDMNGCVNTSVITQNVSLCTGINTPINGSDFLNIFPNPNTGEFTIEAGSDAKLVLVNELGQQLKTIILNQNNHHQFSVSGLANGIYFITGNINERTITQKIVVAK